MHVPKTPIGNLAHDFVSSAVWRQHIPGSGLRRGMALGAKERSPRNMHTQFACTNQYEHAIEEKRHWEGGDTQMWRGGLRRIRAAASRGSDRSAPRPRGLYGRPAGAP